MKRIACLAASPLVCLILFGCAPQRAQPRVAFILDSEPEIAAAPQPVTPARPPLAATQPVSVAPPPPNVSVEGRAHIVYVVDRSGSMVDCFDDVRRDVLQSIARLHEGQTFHVLLCGDGPAKENPTSRLVPGTMEMKKECAEYLKTIHPQGQTDPLPALKRAFEVLAQARDGQKFIYLMTDGEFPDNEAVIKYLAKANADKGVRIHTVLYWREATQAVKVLRQIATDHGGEYKFIAAEQ